MPWLAGFASSIALLCLGRDSMDTRGQTGVLEGPDVMDRVVATRCARVAMASIASTRLVLVTFLRGVELSRPPIRDVMSTSISSCWSIMTSRFSWLRAVSVYLSVWNVKYAERWNSPPPRAKASPYTRWKSLNRLLISVRLWSISVTSGVEPDAWSRHRRERR